MSFHARNMVACVVCACLQVAEEFIGRAVHKAVITVPAYFSDSQVPAPAMPALWHHVSAYMHKPV
jgi:molecular chaperone DnaK (HSP70)